MDDEASSVDSAAHAAADGVLLVHTTLAALTVLIPIPFVGPAVRGYVMRRMVRALAEQHHLRIWEEEVRALVDTESSLLHGAIKMVLLRPIKKMLRKLFVVLWLKRMVDVASACYHRGWLIDRTFSHGWCEPAGPRSARQVREAVDAIVKEVPVASSPVTNAIRIGFEHSRDMVVDAGTALRSRVSAMRGEVVDEEVAKAVDEAEADELGGIEGIVEQLRRALSDVPQEHFDDLDRLLRERLEPESTQDAK